MGIVGSQVDGKDRAGIVKDHWGTMVRHEVWVNSPGRVSQIDSQTCDVVVLRIFLTTTDDCEDDLDLGGSEVPDLKSLSSLAEIASFVSREDCDTGSEVQITTTGSSRQLVGELVAHARMTPYRQKS